MIVIGIPIIDPMMVKLNKIPIAINMNPKPIANNLPVIFMILSTTFSVNVIGKNNNFNFGPPHYRWLSIYHYYSICYRDR